MTALQILSIDFLCFATNIFLFFASKEKKLETGKQIGYNMRDYTLDSVILHCPDNERN